MEALKIGNITVRVPIIQGGMGIGISLSKLASAVANMGGVGIISTVGIGQTGQQNSLGWRKGNIEGVKQEIRKARKMTSGVLGVNIMSVLTDFSDMVRTSIEEGIDIIFSGAGLPLDLPSYLVKGQETKLVPIVSSGRAAAIITQKWKQNYNYLPDAFVVEGPKAGGHLGFKSEALQDVSNKLENLVDEVVKVAREIKQKFNKEVPVIAAGGIFTGRDIHSIMKRGARGVQLGTRFVATEECDASEEFKKAVVDATEDDIHIIKSPVGMPGRSIFNRFLQEANDGKRRPRICKHNCIRSCNPKTTLYCISEALLAAFKGNLKDGFAFVGSNAGRIKKISTVKEIFTELQEEYRVAQQ